MTCIVGLVDPDGRITMGGDSAGVDKLDVQIRKDPKVFIKGEYIFGFSSSFRMGQLLAHSFKPPKPPKDDGALYAFMVNKFIDVLKDCFKKGGYGKQDFKSRDQGGCFLVGVRGRLFQIEADFQVGESTDRFDSIGCGSKYARGALWAMKNLWPDDFRSQSYLAQKALEIAERYSGGVSAPFIIKTLPAPKRPKKS